MNIHKKEVGGRGKIRRVNVNKMVLFCFSGQPKVGKKRVTNYTKSKNTLKLWPSIQMPSNYVPKIQPIMATDQPVT